jgi:hypothetical protein
MFRHYTTCWRYSGKGKQTLTPQPGVVAHTVVLALRKMGWKAHEFGASLGHIEDFVSKKK